MEQPILGYRVFFPNNTTPPEDFRDIESAFKRCNEYLEKTGKIPYIHPLRLGGFGTPVF